MPLYPDTVVSVLNHIGGHVAWSMPDELELALFTDVAGEDEVTGGSYERQAVSLVEVNTGETEAPTDAGVSFTDLPEVDVRSVGLFEVGGAGILYKAITTIEVADGGEITWDAGQVRAAVLG